MHVKHISYTVHTVKLYRLVRGAIQNGTKGVNCTQAAERATAAERGEQNKKGTDEKHLGMRSCRDIQEIETKQNVYPLASKKTVRINPQRNFSYGRFICVCKSCRIKGGE